MRRALDYALSIFCAFTLANLARAGTVGYWASVVFGAALLCLATALRHAAEELGEDIEELMALHDAERDDA